MVSRIQRRPSSGGRGKKLGKVECPEGFVQPLHLKPCPFCAASNARYGEKPQNLTCDGCGAELRYGNWVRRKNALGDGT